MAKPVCWDGFLGQRRVLGQRGVWGAGMRRRRGRDGWMRDEEGEGWEGRRGEGREGGGREGQRQQLRMNRAGGVDHGQRKEKRTRTEQELDPHKRLERLEVSAPRARVGEFCCFEGCIMISVRSCIYAYVHAQEGRREGRDAQEGGRRGTHQREWSCTAWGRRPSGAWRTR